MPGAGRPWASASTARRGWALAVAAVALVAVVSVVFAVTRPVPAPSRDGGSGVIPAASIRAGVLRAIDASAADILVLHRASSIADGEALNEQVWLSPSEPAPGQQVQRRSVIMDASGAPAQDFAVVFRMPADPAVQAGPSVGIDATGAPASAFRTTGSTIDVDYPSRSWSEHDNGSILVALPDDLTEIRAEVATDGWTAEGTATIGGQRAIELSWHATLGTGITHELWVNAGTYLPMREVYAYPARSPGNGPIGTIQSEYTLLPPSTVSLATLAPPVPAGFTDEAAPNANPGS